MYCRNNSLIYTDPDGDYVETALDIVSFAYSFNEYRKNPSLKNLGFMSFDAMMIIAPIGTGSGAFRMAGKGARYWSKGQYVSSAENMMYHFRKHGEKLRVRTPEKYTASAISTARKATQIHAYKNKTRIAFREGKKLTIMEGKKIVTHFRMKGKGYWKRNVKQR